MKRQSATAVIPQRTSVFHRRYSGCANISIGVNSYILAIFLKCLFLLQCHDEKDLANYGQKYVFITVLKNIYTSDEIDINTKYHKLFSAFESYFMFLK